MNDIKLAGVIQAKNYDPLCNVLRVLRQLTDVLIVIDDNSDVPLEKTPEIDVLLTLRKNDKQFYDLTNGYLMHFLAWQNKCDWLMIMDDDFLLSSHLQSRSKINSLIESAKLTGCDMVRAELRDLWGCYRYFRNDGTWGVKAHYLLQRVWFGDRGITLRNLHADRLHRPWFHDAEPKVLNVQHPSRVYHTGCITPSRRQRRVANYKVWDPDNSLQADYSYMLDDSTLRVEPVPDGDVSEFWPSYHLTTKQSAC